MGNIIATIVFLPAKKKTSLKIGELYDAAEYAVHVKDDPWRCANLSSGLLKTHVIMKSMKGLNETTSEREDNLDTTDMVV